MSSVKHTSHHAHFIAFSDPDRYLILLPAPSRALSIVTIFSILSRMCSERQDSRWQQTDQTVHGVEAHEAADGVQTHRVTRGRVQASA